MYDAAYDVLFLLTGNSASAILAECYLNHAASLNHRGSTKIIF